MRTRALLHLFMALSLVVAAGCGSTGEEKNPDAQLGDPDGGDGGDGGSCTPRTCQMLSKPGAPACGVLDDGCGGTLDCDANGEGHACSDPFGVLKCAMDLDGVKRCLHTNSDTCTPLSKAEVCDGACGEVSDGCSGTIQCGGCGDGESCQGNVCAPGACTPIDEAVACAGKCGRVSDGCGAGYNCGPNNGGVSCVGFDYCGAGGTPNQCGCTSTATCDELGFSCGLAKDNCGMIMDCWPEGQNSCPVGQACIGNPASCQGYDPADYCVGPLCDFIPWDCPAESLTRITGRVTTPNGELGVPNAYVYIPRDPNAALPALDTGPSCNRCDEQNLGPLLAGAVTDYKGEFTLSGQIPLGTDFTVVIQSGRWRAVRKIPAGAVSGECAVNELSESYFRLPADRNDGEAGTQLPKIAVATGSADAMECVLYKMGIALNEFSTRDGDGSVHLYWANGASYYIGDVNHSVPASELTSNFMDYSMVIWDCEGRQRTRSPTDHTALRNFVNSGGRFFATDFGADWIRGNGDLDDSAHWTSRGSATRDSLYASFGRSVGVNLPRLQTFARWLDANDAASVSFNGQGDPHFVRMSGVDQPRDYVSEVKPGSEEWLFRTTDSTEATSPGGSWPPSSNVATQTYSFNTPFGAGADAACGRVTYSGFHVALGASSTARFPEHCSGSLTSQEKILAYMIFDLAACISDGEDLEPPDCTPLPHEFLCGEGACGEVPDGCGGLYDCGTQPMTCAELEAECGFPSDGCGGFANCGGCENPLHTCDANYKCVQAGYGPG